MGDIGDSVVLPEEDHKNELGFLQRNEMINVKTDQKPSNVKVAPLHVGI